MKSSNERTEYIPYQSIASYIDLKSDDTVLISSDISKLALHAALNKEKLDPKLLIESFQKKVSDGNLLFPSFINDFQSGDVYDPCHSKTDMGVLAQTSLTLSNFKRTLDPIHSFSITGLNASELVTIETESTFGSNSIFSELVQLDAKMLLIDIDLNHSFTFVHHVEEMMQVTYRKNNTINYKLKGAETINEKKIKFFGKKIGYQNQLNKLLPILLAENCATQLTINESNFILINLKKAFQVIKNDIINNESKNIVTFDFVLYVKSLFKKIFG